MLIVKKEEINTSEIYSPPASLPSGLNNFNKYYILKINRLIFGTMNLQRIFSHHVGNLMSLKLTLKKLIQMDNFV